MRLSHLKHWVFYTAHCVQSDSWDSEAVDSNIADSNFRFGILQLFEGRLDADLHVFELSRLAVKYSLLNECGLG